MTESSEVRASHDEVEAFVGKLREFHGFLDESGQAMLGTILEGAQQGETGGFGYSEERSLRGSHASRGGHGVLLGLERPHRLDRGAGRGRHPGVHIQERIDEQGKDGAGPSGPAFFVALGTPRTSLPQNRVNELSSCATNGSLLKRDMEGELPTSKLLDTDENDPIWPQNRCFRQHRIFVFLDQQTTARAC